VADNAEQSRYEIRVAGELAGYSEYHDFRQQRSFMHTLIEPQFEGRGLGSRLGRCWINRSGSARGCGREARNLCDAR
jgi:predicted GNAT family acetyltransferase